MWVNKSQWTTRKHLNKTYVIKVYRTLLNFVSRGHRGKENRQYISTFLLFAAMAANTYLRVAAGIFNPPPEHNHNPVYPPKLIQNVGIVVARSPRMVLVPVYLASAGIIGFLGILPLFTGRPEAWVNLLAILAGCAIWAYAVYLIRLHFVIIIHSNGVSRWKGIIAPDEKFVDGQDITNIDVNYPRPYWWWHWVDLQRITIDFNGDPGKIDTSENPKKRIKRNRIVMRGVGNGDAVKKLLQQLSTVNTNIAYDTNLLNRKQVSLLMVIARLLAKAGHIYTDYFNQQLELQSEQNKLTKETNAYLKRIADKLDPAASQNLAQTKALPAVGAQKPASQPQSSTPDNGQGNS